MGEVRALSVFLWKLSGDKKVVSLVCKSGCNESVQYRWLYCTIAVMYSAINMAN